MNKLITLLISLQRNLNGKIICIICLLVCSISFGADTLSYKIELSMYGEYSTEEEINEKAIANGWQIEGDKYLYTQDDLKLSDLPVLIKLDDFSVKIEFDRSGNIRASMEASYGDADQGASTSSYLHHSFKNLLTLSGGDYASGMWAVNSKLEVVFSNER